jgi:hypothetical protein
MSSSNSLVDTLRTVSAVLLAGRKTIIESGHLDTLLEIDSLLAVAKTETDRRLALAAARVLARREAK